MTGNHPGKAQPEALEKKEEVLMVTEKQAVSPFCAAVIEGSETIS